MVTLPEGKLYIDGQLRAAEGGKTYEDIGPWTGEVVGHAADASVADMEEAIVAARRAFDETDWSTNHPLRRGLVAKLGEKMKANRDRLVEIARHEIGSAMGAVYGPQVDSPLGHVDELLKLFDEFEWEKDLGNAEFWGTTSHRIVVREPVGVVGAITPWNVPLYIAVGKVIPALLAGCTVILKPAPETPLINAILGELAHEVGFPRGVFNVVTAKDPATLGEMLVTDPRVDLISFTGSTAIGKRIMAQGAATLKRIFLELGGKSANIVFEDVPDFAQAVGSSIVAFHAGQGCAINSRLLVPRSRYEEAVEILKGAYEAYSKMWGDFDEPTNIMGPVVSARQRERVLGYVDTGQAEGARLIAGGRAAPEKGNGFFIEPTCFVDVTSDMKIAREEIFGPVLVVIPFEDEDDAVRIANDSDYGLSGAVQSGDKERAMRVARRIRTGTLGVNGGTWSFADVPFGGYKHSGVGREWGLEGFEEYLETKAIGIGV
ncbi:aldehyde dehydrogenase family protein [Sphingobium tyrosinilyticum]|uniref:Aldehyde dehydrogenase family protein n=1 Tax=Sphingobium tyrosinilyticum TaxID=2715436 RepID=A0ABV9F3T5_9SPHN